MWHTLRYDYLSEFKGKWPCHGLPDSLHSISFEFANNGDLIDIEAFDDEARPMDSAEFDGPALVALSQDAKEFGDISN